MSIKHIAPIKSNPMLALKRKFDKLLLILCEFYVKHVYDNMLIET